MVVAAFIVGEHERLSTFLTRKRFLAFLIKCLSTLQMNECAYGESNCFLQQISFHISCMQKVPLLNSYENDLSNRISLQAPFHIHRMQKASRQNECADVELGCV